MNAVLFSILLSILVQISWGASITITYSQLSDKLDSLSSLFNEQYIWLSHEDVYQNRFGIVTQEDSLKLQIIRSSRYLAWVNERITQSTLFSLFDGYMTPSQAASLQQYQEHLIDIKVKLIKTKMANWRYLSKTGLRRRIVRLLTSAPPSEPFAKLVWVPQLYLALIESLYRIVATHHLSSANVPTEKLEMILTDLHDIGIIVDYGGKDMERRYLHQLISVFGAKPLASIASDYLKANVSPYTTALETEDMNRSNFLNRI